MTGQGAEQDPATPGQSRLHGTGLLGRWSGGQPLLEKLWFPSLFSAQRWLVFPQPAGRGITLLTIAGTGRDT